MEGIDKEMQMNIFFKQKKVKDERLGTGKQEKNTKKDEIGRRKETKNSKWWKEDRKMKERMQLKEWQTVHN